MKKIQEEFNQEDLKLLDDKKIECLDLMKKFSTEEIFHYLRKERSNEFVIAGNCYYKEHLQEIIEEYLIDIYKDLQSRNILLDDFINYFFSIFNGYIDEDIIDENGNISIISNIQIVYTQFIEYIKENIDK